MPRSRRCRDLVEGNKKLLTFGYTRHGSSKACGMGRIVLVVLEHWKTMVRFKRTVGPGSW